MKNKGEEKSAVPILHKISYTEYMEPSAITWRAAEYEYKENNFFSRLVIGAVGTVVVVIALWQKNFFFAVFILIATIMLIILGKKRPRILDFALDHEKLTIDVTEYSYDTIDHFMLRERPGHLHELVFKRKVRLNPHLHVLIDGHLAAKARALLIEKMPELQYDESLLDNIIEWFGI